VLVQAAAQRKQAVAEVALPAAEAAVVGAVGGLVLGGAVPADHVLGDDAGGVLVAHVLVQGVAVEAGGVGAAAALDVVHQPRGGGEARLAEGTLDVLAAVDAGVEVLVRS